MFGVLWPESMAKARKRTASLKGMARTVLVQTVASWLTNRPDPAGDEEDARFHPKQSAL